MALKFPNRARMTTATTGTGTLTLGAAVVSPSKGYYQSFAAAGVANGDTVRYVIEDGSDWEVGTGTYSSSGTTLTRTVLESSNADAAINLSGAAEVYATVLGGDIPQAATDTTPGLTELLTTTELLTGTDTMRAATADAIAALWEKGAPVDSAGTLSLGEGGFFHVTGTTTITDIDFATAKDGRHAILEFDGILTLTHNATTLKLPGGANITTAAGDTCMVVQDSGDNVRVAWYQRASGLPVVAPPAGGIELLATLSSTSGASVSLTGITGSYRHLLVVLMDVSASGTGAFQIAVSSNNGSSYGADVTFTNSQSNATRLYILGWVFQAGVSGSEKTIISSGVTGGQEASVTGVVNAIRVKPAGSLDFDAGSILVFKVP